MAGQRCRERGGNGRGGGGRGDRGGRGPRLRRGLAALSRAAVIVPLALLAAACGDSGTEGLTGLPPIHAAGGTADSTAQRAHDPALVGTWSRTLVVSDSTGASQLAETRWSFAADGSVVRRSITAEFVFGFSDELVERGTWFTSGTSGSGTVTIRLEGDVTQGTTFDYAVTTGTFGRQLVLGSLVYQSLEQ